MSLTIAGALKASLETAGLGVSIFNTFAALRKAAGAEQPLPYLVITDQLSNIPERGGRGDYARTIEQVQVDVYQDRRAMNHQLVRNVQLALKDIRLATAPMLVFRVNVDSTVPTPDPDPNVDRKTITLSLRRRY